ncbi:MAG TPA: MBL fold metallo-hydrolase [Spirochaetes bacterium]|nr:MBL fold metallo-hydrolase [Spirochaetota bacterium]
MLAANCFIIRNENEAIVIDPGGNAEVIYPYIEERTLTYVINTHGHYDHIAANNDLKARYDTKLVVGSLDHELLLDPMLNLSATFDAPFISIAPDLLLSEGDTLQFDESLLEVIHTPGHTKGSICIKMGDTLFSGDTLFYHSIGRTDLPTGSYEELEKSIKTKLYILQDDTKVYTGHGEETIIGEEKTLNEFVRL